MGRWASQPNPDLPQGLVLFDGLCILCTGWVRFLIERDTRHIYCFVPIQSRYGQELAHRFGIDGETPQTNVVVFEQIHFKSDAAIEALRRLPGWRAAAALRIIPKPLRDWLYDRIARNRYRLFGRTDNCMMPTPDITPRFQLEPPKDAS